MSIFFIPTFSRQRDSFATHNCVSSIFLSISVSNVKRPKSSPREKQFQLVMLIIIQLPSKILNGRKPSDWKSSKWTERHCHICYNECIYRFVLVHKRVLLTLPTNCQHSSSLSLRLSTTCQDLHHLSEDLFRSLNNIFNCISWTKCSLMANAESSRKVFHGLSELSSK